jgi:hypothetical protein
MLDFSHIPTPYGASTVESFTANSTVAGGAWQTWTKPRGKTMAHILLVGAGGNGGNSATAAAASGGSGGGSSGAQVSIMLPLWAIPDVLFLSLAYGGLGVTSYVSIAQNTTVNNTLLLANAGGNGAASVTTAAGAAGTAATAPAAGTMPLGWQWVDSAMAGQAGTAGGVATTPAAGTALVLPVTGLLVTGGSGGGACPTTVGAGTAGGASPATAIGVFLARPGGTGGATTTPPQGNLHGHAPVAGLLYQLGGVGGGGVGSNATGAGLVGANGGNGAPGCGGGGAGGCFTGSTLGIGGVGGPAFCQITCW